MKVLTEEQINDIVNKFETHNWSYSKVDAFNNVIWDNEKIAFAAMKECFSFIKCISDRLKSDPIFALKVIEYNGWFLQYFNNNIKLDREIVKLAVIGEPLALMYADKKYHYDPDLLQYLVGYFDNCSFIGEYGNDVIEFHRQSMKILESIKEEEKLLKIMDKTKNVYSSVKKF